jgi:hypothetical protein
MQKNQSATGNLAVPHYQTDHTAFDEAMADEDELLTIRTANSWLKQANKRPVP